MSIYLKNVTMGTFMMEMDVLLFHVQLNHFTNVIIRFQIFVHIFVEME